ncbi:Ger(x)C family spore germination protein [Bacillus cereus]|uniref:Ger(X)C family germination protein n=3 Tax=Bacillus cereus group TaxID=86661 RepID=A0A9W5NZA7_BACCE|nr:MULTISPECIES: Ger(x)C family spore germination protein [Bacillus cereus group]EKS8372229.1 Ger(x)C family spore germination protein [Bacillus cereus]AHA75378.1 spore germination protein QC [Bacillus thuringiensis YBT-1518]EEM44496.1 Spore germination protein [Bacillus thuringiensis serovar pakistani str. T13001]EJR62185.1 Ger(X)C family germination protein [Bacillus cereus VD154]KIU74088.1 spore germination protein QC [Bacillus thuringiensis Sbt003]
MKIRFIIFLCIMMLLVFIFGRVPKEVLDDIQLAKGVGYDSSSTKNQMQVSGVYAVYNPDKTITNKVLTTTSSLSKESLEKQNEQSDEPIANGKLEVALFGHELSKKGISTIIDTFHRDANVSSRLLLAIVDGKAKNVLEKKYGNKDTGSFLANLLEHNMAQGLLPKNNLHLFLTSYFSKLKDPVLPLLKLEGKYIRIEGIALFKKGRYVKKIHRDNLFIFKALRERVKLGHVKVKISKDVDVSVQSVVTHRKFLIRTFTPDPQITLRLKVKGLVREFQGKRISQDIIQITEKAMKHSLEKQGDAIIKECQELHIDPVGIGNEARSRIRHFNIKRWEKQYPKLKVKVIVEPNITEYGVVDGNTSRPGIGHK